MAKNATKANEARIQRGALSAAEAEELFSTVDDTGHSNREAASRERSNRKKTGFSVSIDPLSEDDPSGSNVERVITRTAVVFVAVFVVLVTATQLGYAMLRRINTAQLSESATVSSVASALSGGVEWGNGFTQFPQSFSVQEADENTHRIDVSVVDTSSKNVLEALAGSQIQASAFAVNALLNPNINTVIYRVQAHVDAQGNYERAQFFGFVQPQGELKSIMTFVWTKVQTEQGVQLRYTLVGLDKDAQEQLKANITSSFTPSSFISSVFNSENSSQSGTTEPQSEKSSEAGSTESAPESGKQAADTPTPTTENKA